MKSPQELSQKFARQWENANLREARLLGGGELWPISLLIGRPKPRVMASDLDAVRRHVERWRKVRLGSVSWEPVSYRATSEPVSMPLQWQLHIPSDWIDACCNPEISREFEILSNLVENTPPEFHRLLIRRRLIWRNRSVEEVLQATRLAQALEPGCAMEKPLRAISLCGIDTKFFERNEGLITALLDVRFDGEVSRLGLEQFLDAAMDGSHWLLVVDLDGSLLPFQKQKVPSFELKRCNLSTDKVLIVENEQCLHQLPRIPNTIAIMGAGFDLTWTEGQWLQDKQVGYWGDIDTWGLKFLGKTRVALPNVHPLMMTLEVFIEHCESFAVPEPVSADVEAPTGLTSNEKELYRHILLEEKGRLEQEFLPFDLVHKSIKIWGDS